MCTLVILSSPAWPSLLAGKELIFRTSAVWTESSSRPGEGVFPLAWGRSPALLSLCPFWGLAANLGLSQFLLWFLPGQPLVPGRWAAAGVLEEWAG